MPQSSLRTALQQLETMASVRAARIMDKLNAGLQKMTSHRVFDGVLRHGVVGREVSSAVAVCQQPAVSLRTPVVLDLFVGLAYICAHTSKLPTWPLHA